MHVTAIVLAAGKGERLKTRIPKPLVKINSKPAIFYCLHTLNSHPGISDIVVVVNNKNQQAIKNKIKAYDGAGKVKNIVLGGKRRQDSVLSGLKALDKKTELVLIHDVARPFPDRLLITRVIAEARKCGAAIAGIPVKSTLKKVKGKGQLLIEKTIDRDGLWEIQTPQVFSKEIILKAYNKFQGVPVTDDSSLVEKLGHPVRIVKGSISNIKITTPEDLILAEAIAKVFKLCA